MKTWCLRSTHPHPKALCRPGAKSHTPAGLPGKTQEGDLAEKNRQQTHRCAHQSSTRSPCKILRTGR
jgi:hypothetical protein